MHKRRREERQRRFGAVNEEMIDYLHANVVHRSLAGDLIIGVGNIVYILDDVLSVTHWVILNNVIKSDNLIAEIVIKRLLQHQRLDTLLATVECQCISIYESIQVLLIFQVIIEVVVERHWHANPFHPQNEANLIQSCNIAAHKTVHKRC